MKKKLFIRIFVFIIPARQDYTKHSAALLKQTKVIKTIQHYQNNIILLNKTKTYLRLTSVG